jgi:hypothetical protein
MFTVVVKHRKARTILRPKWPRPIQKYNQTLQGSLEMDWPWIATTGIQKKWRMMRLVGCGEALQAEKGAA